MAIDPDVITYFNSTKVQFRACGQDGVPFFPGYFNSTKVQFRDTLRTKATRAAHYFNSTKVQFRAVKLDRKYHINKGFEKRFR